MRDGHKNFETKFDSGAWSVAVCSLFIASLSVFAQGTAFTYQGRLNDNASASTFKVVVSQLYFSGFVNSILGDLSLVIAPGGTGGPASMLVLSNLSVGPNGANGLHIEGPGADGVLVNFQPFDLRSIGSLETLGCDVTDNVFGRGLHTGGSNATLSLDFSPLNARDLLMQVSDGHGTISSATIANGSAIDINTLFPDPCPNGTSFYSVTWLTNGA